MYVFFVFFHTFKNQFLDDFYVFLGGKEHNASSYEVLTQENPSNPTIHWVRSEGSAERVPPLAIQGGYISSTGEPLYIGRIRLNTGVVCCGKVILFRTLCCKYLGRCYFWLGITIIIN